MAPQPVTLNVGISRLSMTDLVMGIKEPDGDILVEASVDAVPLSEVPEDFPTIRTGEWESDDDDILWLSQDTKERKSVMVLEWRRCREACQITTG